MALLTARPRKGKSSTSAMRRSAEAASAATDSGASGVKDGTAADSMAVEPLAFIRGIATTSRRGTEQCGGDGDSQHPAQRRRMALMERYRLAGHPLLEICVAGQAPTDNGAGASVRSRAAGGADLAGSGKRRWLMVQ